MKIDERTAGIVERTRSGRDVSRRVAVCLPLLSLASGCAMVRDGSSGKSSTQSLPKTSSVMNAGRSLLVEIIQRSGHEFPKIGWYQVVQLDLAASVTDGVTGFDMAIASRASEIDRWADFVHLVAEIAGRQGFTNPQGVTSRHGGAPAHMTLEAPDGRSLDVSGDKGTIINLHVEATKIDDRSIATGVIWRDGKNVMDPGAIK